MSEDQPPQPSDPTDQLRTQLTQRMERLRARSRAQPPSARYRNIQSLQPPQEQRTWEQRRVQIGSRRQGSIGHRFQLSANSALEILERQIGACERYVNQLIDTEQSSEEDEERRESDARVATDGGEDATDATDARIARVMTRVEELNRQRDMMTRFLENPEPFHADREQLRAIFDIVRHAYEFDLRHPEPAPQRYGEPGGRSNFASLLAAMSSGSMETRVLDVGDGRVEFGTFNLARQGGSGLLRAMLGGGGAFWDNVMVPLETALLERMPSQTYRDVLAARNSQCNNECNICLMAFEPDDMVRVFPCCELAQHTTCLEEWFKTHDSCIVCRKKLGDVLRPAHQAQPEAPEAPEASNANGGRGGGNDSSSDRRSLGFLYQLLGLGHDASLTDDNHDDGMQPD